MSRLTVLGVLVALTIAAYASTWRAGFVYEDLRTVLANGEVQQTQPWRWHELRSLSVLSFRLNHALDGNNPRGYHVSNVAVHLVNGLLVYAVASALLGQTGALLAALLFLLSPLSSEAVAYVSGRTELLSALSILTALYLATRRPKVWYFAAIPFVLGFGLLAKETALVGFPLVLMVYAVRYPARVRLRPSLAVWVCLCAGLACWVLWPLRHLSVGTTGSERGYLSYIAIQASALWRYLALVVWPDGLTIDHDWDLISHPLAYAALALILLLPVLAWRLWRRVPVLAFSIAFVCIAVLPRFLIRIPEYLNEHQMYVPMIGISLGLAATAQYALAWYHDTLLTWWLRPIPDDLVQWHRKLGNL